MSKQPAWVQGLVRIFERLFLAHMLAYPLAFAWAAGTIPLAFHFFIDQIDALNEDMPLIGQFVVRRVAWPAGAAFLLCHLVALPWAFGKDPAVGKRWFLRGAAVLALGAVVVGGASWIWLFTR